jgi:ABC-2 type transport system permease protein
MRMHPRSFQILTVIRMIWLKGSGFHDMLHEFYSLVIYVAISLSLAVWQYRKTT